MITGIISGILAGYVASRIHKGQGSGCLTNLFLGLIGGLIGGWLFSLVGLEAYRSPAQGTAPVHGVQHAPAQVGCQG